MIRTGLKIFLFLGIGTLLNCEDTNPVDTSDPSNLAVEVNVSEDGSGTIEVIATADNAVEYQLDLGVNGVDNLVNTTGVFNYTYELTGVYQIEVRAVGASGRFSKKSSQFTIQVGDSTGPIDGVDGYITPLTYEGLTLVWQDEFVGSGVNTSDWNFETGTGSGGWGNNELQYYRNDNVTVKDGYLTIEARKESFQNSAYTSSRLTTQNKFTFKYGRVDIRARVPKGQGIWPALWLLGDNIGTVGWPKCGEIDIMEMIGGGNGRDNVVHGTIHWDEAGSHAQHGGSRQLLTGILNDRFHVFTIIWDDTSIKWYIDDIQYHASSTTPTEKSEFNNEFFFIFNVAVGGNWPGSPNASTLFPQQMVVDYVRVFQ